MITGMITVRITVMITGSVTGSHWRLRMRLTDLRIRKRLDVRMYHADERLTDEAYGSEPNLPDRAVLHLWCFCPPFSH